MKKVLRISAIITLTVFLIAAVCLVQYLFFFDLNKPQKYFPYMDTFFLDTTIERLPEIEENISGEVNISEKDFKGIVKYVCLAKAEQDDVNYLDNKDSFNGYIRRFSDESIELFVYEALYTPVIEAWQYGWWDRNGNLYADMNGHDAAKQVPNYRNCFRFCVVKGNSKYYFTVFSSDSDAQKAFLRAVLLIEDTFTDRKPIDSNNISAKECYEKILKNEQTFYSVVRETDLFLSDYNKKAWRYSFVDMDGDNIDELAIMFEDSSVLILRKDSASVIGFDFGHRGMAQIFTDGSFLWNQDSGNTYGCSKLEFSGKTYKTIELWRVENKDSSSAAYYIDGNIATKEELDSLNQKNNPEYTNWSLCS